MSIEDEIAKRSLKTDGLIGSAFMTLANGGQPPRACAQLATGIVLEGPLAQSCSWLPIDDDMGPDMTETRCHTLAIQWAREAHFGDGMAAYRRGLLHCSGQLAVELGAASVETWHDLMEEHFHVGKYGRVVVKMAPPKALPGVKPGIPAPLFADAPPVMMQAEWVVGRLWIQTGRVPPVLYKANAEGQWVFDRELTTSEIAAITKGQFNG